MMHSYWTSFLVHMVLSILNHTHLMARPYMRLDDKVVPEHVGTTKNAIKVLFASHNIVSADTVLQLLVGLAHMLTDMLHRPSHFAATLASIFTPLVKGLRTASIATLLSVLVILYLDFNLVQIILPIFVCHEHTTGYGGRDCCHRMSLFSGGLWFHTLVILVSIASRCLSFPFLSFWRIVRHRMGLGTLIQLDWVLVHKFAIHDGGICNSEVWVHLYVALGCHLVEQFNVYPELVGPNIKIKTFT